MRGLWQQIEANRKEADELRRHAANPRTDPHSAHDCEVRSKTLLQDAEKLEGRAKANASFMTALEAMVEEGERSPHQSRFRSIALRKMEEAAMWLRRENGEQPS